MKQSHNFHNICYRSRLPYNQPVLTFCKTGMKDIQVHNHESVVITSAALDWCWQHWPDCWPLLTHYKMIDGSHYYLTNTEIIKNFSLMVMHVIAPRNIKWFIVAIMQLTTEWTQLTISVTLMIESKNIYLTSREGWVQILPKTEERLQKSLFCHQQITPTLR